MAFIEKAQERRVRTPEGEEQYGLPIGSVIRADDEEGNAEAPPRIAASFPFRANEMKAGDRLREKATAEDRRIARQYVREVYDSMAPKESNILGGGPNIGRLEGFIMWWGDAPSEKAYKFLKTLDRGGWLSDTDYPSPGKASGVTAGEASAMIDLAMYRKEKLDAERKLLRTDESARAESLKMVAPGSIQSVIAHSRALGLFRNQSRRHQRALSEAIKETGIKPSRRAGTRAEQDKNLRTLYAAAKKKLDTLPVAPQDDLATYTPTISSFEDEVKGRGKKVKRMDAVQRPRTTTGASTPAPAASTPEKPARRGPEPYQGRYPNEPATEAQTRVLRDLIRNKNLDISNDLPSDADGKVENLTRRQASVLIERGIENNKQKRANMAAARSTSSAPAQPANVPGPYPNQATRMASNGIKVYRTIQGAGQTGTGMTSGASSRAGYRPAKVHAADADGKACCGQKITAGGIAPRWSPKNEVNCDRCKTGKTSSTRPKVERQAPAPKPAPKPKAAPKPKPAAPPAEATEIGRGKYKTPDGFTITQRGSRGWFVTAPSGRDTGIRYNSLDSALSSIRTLRRSY